MKLQQFLQRNPFLIIDAGARGRLIEPWCTIDRQYVKVIGFEPDQDEVNKLNKNNLNRKYYPYALWKNNGEIEINIAKNEFTSSIYRPNSNIIKKFEDKHWKFRLTQRRMMVTCTTLDFLLKKEKIDPDFLKIDTQGAEYEILQGSNDALTKNIICVLVETWTIEVHKGQKLSGEIMTYMNTHGFDLFDINIAAAWNRKSILNLNRRGKRQIIGLDLLFFKRENTKTIQNIDKMIKLAIIADMYGFPDFALDLLDEVKKSTSKYSEIIYELRQNIFNKWRTDSIFSNINKLNLLTLKRSLLDFLSSRRSNSNFPPLH